MILQTCAVLWLYTLALQAQPAPEPVFVIAGTVIHAVTRAPLSRARVSLSKIEGAGSDESGGQGLTVVTAADGNFAFTSLPAGKYMLSAERFGFVGGNYGQRSADYFVGITVESGNVPGHLNFPLQPQAVIEGVIRDESGEPLANTNVALFTSRVQQGRRQLVSVLNGSTNDRGAYRFASLPSGKYLIAAGRGPNFQGNSDASRLGNPEPNIAYPTTYYPGDDTMAAVRSGQELRADMVLQPARCVRVRGRVRNFAQPSGAVIFLRSTGHPAATTFNFPASVNHQDGAFEVFNVPSGEYHFIIETGQPDKQLFAEKTIRVGSSDIEGIDIELSPLPQVSGAVQVIGPEAPPLDRFAIVLERQDGPEVQPTERRIEQVQLDGKFTIPSVRPGKYRLMVNGTERVYIKSVMLGDKDVYAAGFSVSGPLSLQVTLSTGTGTVNGKTASGAFVILLPKTGPIDMDSSRADQADEDGHFSFELLAPGEYLLFAFEHGEQLEYAKRGSMQPYANRAEKITVVRGATRTVNPNLIREDSSR